MLSERTIEILENNDMTIHNKHEQHGEFVREIEFYSPEGEDVIETIFYDGTDEGFIREFKAHAVNFDADEHAEMWIEGRGKRGVPESVRDLITDAEWIKDTLLSVADELEGKHKEKKLYKCTITITGGEQTEEQDFYVEAYSFEEATENIKADLDI